MFPRETLKKVLVVGSGGIVIGQAAEFDYSGSQALKALREEGIETVLVNPNVATIQTSLRMADKVYLEPLTPNVVAEIIRKEKPDGILLSFGGQTALNVGVELKKMGVLESEDVKVLGTSIETIEATEDRDLFRKAMLEAEVPIPKSQAVYSVNEAVKVADDLGYPVIVRVAYTLGGGGSGVAYNKDELKDIALKALELSPAHQVLVEQYLENWKEIEYEVMRDYVNIISSRIEEVGIKGILFGTGTKRFGSHFHFFVDWPENFFIPAKTQTSKDWFSLPYGRRAIESLKGYLKAFLLKVISEEDLDCGIEPQNPNENAISKVIAEVNLTYRTGAKAIGSLNSSVVVAARVQSRQQ